MSRRRVLLWLPVLLLAGCKKTGPTTPPAPTTPVVTPAPTTQADAPSPQPTRSAASDWQSLLPAVDPATAVAGNWSKTADGLRTSAANGARIALPFTPPAEYDFRASFTRHTGIHSIGLFFTHGTGRAAFEVDAWGQHLAGIQDIAGQSFRDNPTRRPNMTLVNGRRYTMTVEVRSDQVRTLLDDQEVATFRTDGSDLSLSNLWAMPGETKLGLGAWEAETTFHTVEVRSADERRGLSPPKVAEKPKPSGGDEPRRSSDPPAAGRATGKRVLIVIANQDFYYREYGDPRQELERAGVRVTVAAGRRGACRPHNNSGEGSDGGVVQAEIALADVNADDYDAVLFSGGWGSSMYQFAFPGRYDNVAYNGSGPVKQAANRVIGDFLARDKYTCALCNGVTVLAWARVNGQSPLRGKRVCAPTRPAAAGIYDGRRAQPSCRWHPEANGAVLSPAGSIGRPDTAADDVLVDGRIVTGEDDISAREMGRRMVQLLGG